MAKTTGLASITESGGEVRNIDPRLLKVRDNWNSRNFNDAENSAYIEELTLSVIEVGVLQPLTVTYEKGQAWIDDGECRWRAACLAIERTGNDKLRVPVRSEERYASPQDRLINQRVRNSGKPFTIFEDAAFFKRLVEGYKMKQEEVAKKCNISAARVSQILEYNTVGTVGRTMVANGQASASLVMEVTKNEGSEAEKVLLAGLKAAKKAGVTKVKPAHVEGSVKVNVKAAVIDAFEYADVDDSDDEVVVVKFPAGKWEVLRDILKL